MPQKVWTYIPGSAPGDEFVDDPVAAQQFMCSNAPDTVVIGSPEVRRGEQDWVVEICRKNARKIGIPLLDIFPGTAYWHYAVRMVFGVVCGLFYGPLVMMRAMKLPRLEYDTWALDDHRTFDKRHPSNARFMRGISSAWALKLLSGAVFVGIKRFEERIVQNLIAILRKYPDTVIQFELPLELALGALAWMPFGVRQWFYGKLLKSAGRIIRQTPKGTCFAFHLCWGDLGRKPIVPKSRQRVKAKIALINAITAMPEWQEGWKLFAIHEPFGDGEHAPRVSEKDLKQYRKYLNPLPAETFYALGVLHAGNDAQSTITLVKRLIEVISLNGSMTAFAIATPCGMGRMSLGHATELFRKAQEVSGALG